MNLRVAAIALSLLFLVSSSSTQEIPIDYQQILKIVDKSGDYKADVLKVNVPRNDVHVTIGDLAVPTPFGFGGWFAMTKGNGGEDVMMGDLVLLQEEVNPVMSALLDNGLEVTALHNHFFWETPRMYYMHIHGHGKAADLAQRVKPVLDLIGKVNLPRLPAVVLPPQMRRAPSTPLRSRRSLATTANRMARFTKSQSDATISS